MFQDISHTFFAMLAVINPMICAAMLMQIPSKEKTEQLKNATRSMGIVWIVLMVSSIGGVYILKAFGISMPAFQLLGGIVLTFIGFHMFGSKANNKSDIDLNQLVMFAASPGTIAMAITFSSQSNSKIIPYNEIIGITAALIITLLLMVIIIKVNKPVAKSKQSYSTQFMGLIVAGMGLQFALEGIKTFFIH